MGTWLLHTLEVNFPLFSRFDSRIKLSVCRAGALPGQPAKHRRCRASQGCTHRAPFLSPSQTGRSPGSIPPSLLATYITDWFSAPKQQNQPSVWCKEPTNRKGFFHQSWDHSSLMICPAGSCKASSACGYRRRASRQEEITKYCTNHLKGAKDKEAWKARFQNKTLAKLEEPPLRACGQSGARLKRTNQGTRVTEPLGKGRTPHRAAHNGFRQPISSGIFLITWKHLTTYLLRRTAALCAVPWAILPRHPRLSQIPL